MLWIAGNSLSFLHISHNIHECVGTVLNLVPTQPAWGQSELQGGYVWAVSRVPVMLSVYFHFWVNGLSFPAAVWHVGSAHRETAASSLLNMSGIIWCNSQWSFKSPDQLGTPSFAQRMSLFISKINTETMLCKVMKKIPFLDMLKICCFFFTFTG